MIPALQLFSQHRINKAKKPINIVEKRQQKKTKYLTISYYTYIITKFKGLSLSKIGCFS